MNDFYEGRMIPLKIADMAIINCNKEIEKLQIENARLKAEVERLNLLTSEMDKTINISQAGCRQLKAENERLRNLATKIDVCVDVLVLENGLLRKAGDAMASSIQFNEEMAQDYNGPTIVHQCVQRWNAAKEGKPTSNE